MRDLLRCDLDRLIDDLETLLTITVDQPGKDPFSQDFHELHVLVQGIHDLVQSINEVYAQRRWLAALPSPSGAMN